MKAMVLNGANRPFELMQVPDPVAGPGEAVARVITCGSGLTIQHVKAGRRAARFPRIIGHEITAEIVALGAGGGLGIHQVMMAKWARARVIAVDRASPKLDACRKAGADEVVDASAGDVAQALLDLTHGEGIDVAIDYVSSTATLEAGAKALGRHGRLVTLGGAGQPFTASAHDILMKEQELLGSRYVTRTEILETLDLVARGEVWPLVTDIRPLAEAEAVHQRVERGEVIGRAALVVG
jgi:propanol-preferring alcohol dehydrogenase